MIRIVVLAAALLACSGSQKSKSSANNAVILVSVAEPEAAIWVDGRFVAIASQAKGGVSVEPGSHRIEIRHDRYHTHYQLIEVTPKQRLRLEVELAEDLP
ncbi:MAG: PEGA domain-containing protein [Deltaproteobacteria bacterium]|nr:PEGA domain-containing protein [Deltaproteobacteria bacterium]